MQRFIKVSLPILVIALASVMAFIIFPQFKSPAEQHIVEKKALLVEAQVVERRSLNFTIESQGVVKPRTQTTLAAEVSGKITSVSKRFIAGGFLNKGEVLLEIDPSDYRVGVKLAEATLASRKAQFSSEKARSEQALKDWQRLNGSSGKANDLVLRLPQLAEAKANVRAAEADLERARRNLQRTKIRMPYAGMVRAKRVDIGQFVSPGTPLGTMFAVDMVEIRLPVTSEELMFINLPEYSEISVEKRPQVILSTNTRAGVIRWQAELVRSEGVVDEKSRQIYLVAQIVDPYGLLGQSQQPPLSIGTFLSAQIEGKLVDNLFVIPRHALTNGNQLMVVSTENRLEFRQVEVVRSTPKEVYISSGLNDGDRVISTSLATPVEGMPLRVSDVPAEVDALEDDVWLEDDSQETSVAEDPAMLLDIVTDSEQAASAEAEADGGDT
ncbi:MAG: efflux RND transporter periplasmic adaptor subunit [Xanthomonadales bacterium]|nr:efflux RND transporter periplasmic adaptor subunit [Xanthomonadales bacterium]